jgi:glycine hydroxymethyltransferase
MGISSELNLLLTQEADWRQQTISLNASENYTSPLVKKIIGEHPSYDFYAFPPSGGVIEGPWYFSGPPYLEQIEQHISHLGQQLLNCVQIDARPKGGQAAEIAVLLGLAEAGDSVFYVQERDGGHFGLNFLSQKLGIHLIPICFNNENFQIDIQQTLRQMQITWRQNTQRKLVLIGQSFILRPQPLQELVEVVKNEFNDVLICYDVSHTLGLIIGQQFPNPILQNVDLIHGSTHKTFPGPQKAIIGFPAHLDKKLKEAVQYALSPGLQSNCGTSEILALAVALEEMKVYGKDYAIAVCQHAKYFASLLSRVGLNVVGKHFGFTETHQFWIVIGNEQQAWQAFGNLHQAGIRAYPAYLPYVNAWGLRLSTNAITRLGFQAEEIRMLANWIKQILIDKIPFYKINNHVQKLMQAFPIHKVKYDLSDITMIKYNSLSCVE